MFTCSCKCALEALVTPLSTKEKKGWGALWLRLGCVWRGDPMEVRKSLVGLGTCKQKTRTQLPQFCQELAKSTALSDTTPKAGQSGSVHAGTLGSSRPSWVNRSTGAKQANKSRHGSRLLQSPPPSSFPAPPGLPIKQMGPGVLWSISLPFTREKRIYRKGELSPICDLPQGSLQGAVSFTHPAANGKREK